MIRSKRLLSGLVLLALVLLVWAGVFLSWALFDASLAQWTLIVTAAAVATEVAIWIGAALLGFTALQRFSAWRRLRRGR